jgi:hypothetical protein
MRSTGISLFVILLLSASLIEGQGTGGGQPGQTSQPGQTAQPGLPGPANPQRMPARPLRPGETPPKGSAVIRGQVRMDGTGAPVRRAQVRAMSNDGRGGGVTSTNNEGSYEIRDLPAGRYSIMASKGSFVTGQFGQRRPGDPGTPIELADGQTAEKVNFVLSRGAVIAGRLVDDGGEPVAGANVTAMRLQFVGGQQRMVPGGSEGSNDRTDDQGTYRLYGLAPGEYFVSANDRNNNFGPPGINNTESDGFAPTYFPGTSSLAEATRITVKAGQEAAAPFALIVARMAKIRGRVLSSSGEPIGRSMLMLTPADPMMGFMSFSNANNAMVDSDGVFQFANVAPGRYTISVRPMTMPGGTSEFATMPITVASDDIDNVLITTSPGATVRGVVLTDDGTPLPFRADQVQIFASSLDPSTRMMGSGPPKINPDFTFELTGMMDRRIIRGNIGMGQNTGWLLKAVIYDGQDVIDTGIDFQPGRAYDGVQLIFTQKTTELSGVVTDDRNQPIVDATIVVFPLNSERWGMQSRYLRMLRPDTNGRYSIRNLPPLDEYGIIAVRSLDMGQGSDPEFLTRARDDARPFSLAEGETKNLDVKVSTIVP